MPRSNHRLYPAFLLAFQLILGCSSEPAVKNDRAAQQSASAAVPATAAEAGQYDRLLLVFGDSLYAGYHLAPNEGFAPMLEQALDGRGLKVRVVNGGVSGDTSAAGLQRLAFTLDGLPRKPDLVILGLGANDMLRGLDPAETRANLRAILEELHRRGIKTMLTGMLAAPNLGKPYADRFNPIYPDLAREFGVPLYPFFLDGVANRPALLLDDGMHPNARGIGAIVGKIAPEVAAQLD